MSRKRKRLRKILMAKPMERDREEYYINIGLIMDLSYADMIAQLKGNGPWKNVK